MKLSTCLFLLYFTLSTSVYFKIIKNRGLHLWNISDDENSYPDYMRIKYPNYSEFGISKSSYSLRDVSSSSSVQQSTSILKTSNVYIILHINRRKHYFLYYWVGAQSSEQKRKNVAVSVAFIFKNQILEQMPKAKLEIFHREAEGMESISFINLFKLPTSKNFRLYRIAGSKGQFIMEVPLLYSELNGSDSFVLDMKHKVYQLDSIYSNKYKINHANSLRKRILTVNEKMLHSQPLFSWLRNNFFLVHSSTIIECARTEFLKNLTGVPESQEFPQEPANYSDSELADKRREKVTLYEYTRSMLNYVIDERLVPWTVLKFNMLNEDNAYVLQDSLCGNIIVYLGSNANTEQITESLSKAEQFSRDIRVNDAWQRIRILRQRPKFPIWFEIYFKGETEEM